LKFKKTQKIKQNLRNKAMSILAKKKI